MLCALFDEALSFCVEINRHARTSTRETLFTVNLSVDFRAPVITSGPTRAGQDGDLVVVLEGWLERTEGRKWTCRARVLGFEEKEEGKVYSEAKGIWVAARAEKL